MDRAAAPRRGHRGVGRTRAATARTGAEPVGAGAGAHRVRVPVRRGAVPVRAHRADGPSPLYLSAVVPGDGPGPGVRGRAGRGDPVRRTGRRPARAGVRPAVGAYTCPDSGERRFVEAGFVAGCDGARGVSRAAPAPDRVRVAHHDYGVGRPAEAPPSSACRLRHASARFRRTHGAQPRGDPLLPPVPAGRRPGQLAARAGPHAGAAAATVRLTRGGGVRRAIPRRPYRRPILPLSRGAAGRRAGGRPRSAPRRPGGAGARHAARTRPAVLPSGCSRAPRAAAGPGAG